jgi:GH15 family glucan-1,4-alpha-glucosidase
MCWVALDRGLRLADKRSFPADRARWLAARDAVYEEVMARGWSESRGAFVQSYGADALDASALLMPLTFFMAPNDPRMLATVDAIRSPAAGAGWPPTGWSTATTRRPPRTGCRGWRGRSTCAASGWSRP